MTWYNQTRQVEELLAKNESHPPSFSVHLHPEHWTLNHGPKFLYNNHVASLLDDIRNHQIPVDFLDTFESARVPFYEGCMIVEILDYRPGKPTDAPLEAPERSRTVLHPTSESLWADICALNVKQGSKWTDMDALEVEAKILLATTPPLCLDPDPNLTRMVNHVVKVSAPTVPTSLKRKASAVVQEEDETGKARRAKIMQFMASRSSRPSSFRLLENLQTARETVKTTTTTKSVAQAPPASARSSPAPSTTSAAPTPYTKPPTPVPEKIPQQPKDVPANQQTFTAPIHPHPTQQQFHIQNPAVTKTNTPSPRTQTPHQAHQVPTFAVQVQDVTSRNPTPSKQHTQIQPQQTPPRAAPPISQPTVVPTPQPAAFQGVLPNPQFLQRPPVMPNNQMKMTKAPNGATFTGMQQIQMMPPQQQDIMRQRYVYMQQPQHQQQQQTQVPQQQHQQPTQPQPHPQQQQQVQQQTTQPQQLTPQQQQQAQALQQHRQQQIQHAQHQLQQAQNGGRSSTAPTPSAMMSPHVANQRIASRSPMPHQPQGQAAQVHLTPHQTHATPHQAHATPHQQHATPQPQPTQQHATPLQQHTTIQQTPQMYQYNNAAAAAAQFHQRNAVPGAANGSTASPRPQIQGQGQMYAYGYPQMYRLPPNITPQQAQLYWRMNPQMQGMNMTAQQLQQQQSHHQQLAAAQAAAANMKPQAGR